MGQFIKKENITIVTGEYQGQQGMKKEYKTIGELVTMQGDDGQLYQFGKLWGAGGVTEIKIYPQRKPEDGEINVNWSADKIHNFIRAQTKPYPGAFFIINGKKITIWDAKIENL